MLARAIALASVLGEDAAPLDVLPEPWAALARTARARLSGPSGGARAALLARETVALFAPPPPPAAKRLLPRGLAIALAPPEAAPPAGALPTWLARACSRAPALGLSALARASADDAPGPTAELLRRLTTDEAAAFVVARRAAAAPAEQARGRTVVALARRDERVPSLPRRVGLMRLAWAASVEPGALAALAAASPADERDVIADAGRALWFAASEHAVAERAGIEAEVEHAP